MTEKGKPDMLIVAVLVVIVSFGLLEWAAIEIVKIDLTTIENAYIFNFVRFVRPVLIGAPIAIAIGFGLNLRGYLTKYLREKRKNEPHADYSFTWFSETIVKMEGFILCVTPFIEVVIQNAPPEYKAAAMAAAAGAFAIFKIALSELKNTIADTKTKSAISTPAPIPTVPH